MTWTDGLPPTAPLPRLDAAWEVCDHCQSPLDERQRYCVACGARRPTADDPVARWFVAADRRARADASGDDDRGRRGGRGGGAGVATAIAFALLPLAAAVGVFVGRGAGDDRALLVEALRAQKPPVVNIVGGAGTGAAAVSDDDAGGGSDDGGTADEKAARDEARRSARDGGRVIAHTRYGDARQLTGARVTARTRAESRRALEKIANSKGKEYVESQRGLPDQIVIP